MRATGKTVKFEDVFPYLGITDDGVMVSKKGAITLGWKLTLPVVFTSSEEDYDNIIQAFGNAIRALPPWYIVHKQDLYFHEEWKPDREPAGFLTKCNDEHFMGRQYMTHSCYVFLTMSSQGTVMKNSMGSGLFGLGKGVLPKYSSYEMFLSKSLEFESILSSTSSIKMRRLNRNDIIGTQDTPGIIQRYIFLGDKSGQMSDIVLTRETVGVFDKEAQAASIYKSEALQPSVASVKKNELLSQDNNDVLQSFGSSLGPLLDCEHVVNSFFIVPDQEGEKARLLKEQKKMNKGRDDNDNALNMKGIQNYIDKMNEESPMLVRANINIIAWDAPSKRNEVLSKLSSAVSSIGATYCHVKYNVPLLWYAGMPGNATELGIDNMMSMELYSCLCLQIWDTYQFDIPGGMFRTCDRVRHIPIVIDTQAKAMELGYVYDYNAFILGPSGTGKSFFMNYYLKNCYDFGEHVFIIDVGDSYEGLCAVVREESDGKDGQYMSWDSAHPLTFNPFIGFEDWIDENGNIRPDSSGANFFFSLLETIWAPAIGWNSDNEPILKQMVADFAKSFIGKKKGKKDRRPIFDDFYIFLGKTVEPLLNKGTYKLVDRNVGVSSFDIDGFSRALSAYSKNGIYGFLLNNPDPADIFVSRFIVFEVSKLSDIQDKKFYSLCILCMMNAFDRKMRETLDFDVIVIEEAWKAIANETMEPYLRELWKTARKYSASAVVVTQQASDITSSNIIKDAILKNSSTKILLNQYNNKNSFDPIAEALSLSVADRRKIFSMELGKDARYHYRDVFIKLGEAFSAVFSTEVSREEAVAFESMKTKKAPFLKLSAELGSCIQAIKKLVA